MTKNFDSIDKALNVESSIVEIESSPTKIETVVETSKIDIDIKKDYEYTRSNLYSLIEKGQEAVNGILELAGEGDSPRAYEVAGQLIKNIGDVTDKLIDLQKKMKDLDEDRAPKGPNSVTNNAVFIGSTSELLKTLKTNFLNNKE
jgi:hypothetical protein